MSYWDILGIEKTKDLKVIKKAYAKQLKTIDIDQDILAFQELKEAFDWAQTFAKNTHDGEPDSVFSQPSHGENGESFSNEVDDRVDSGLQDSQDRQSAVTESQPTLSRGDFTTQFADFITEKEYFADVTKWATLLEPFLYTSVEIFDYIQDELRRFTVVNYRILSIDVRKYLYDLSQLRDDAMGREVLAYPAFHFEFYQEIPMDQRELYFQQRASIYDTFFDDIPIYFDLKELKKCQSIYLQDKTVNLFEAYMLLWNDFRLDNPATIDKIRDVSKRAVDDSEWQFIESYLTFVQLKKGYQREPKLIAYFSTINGERIPPNIFNFLMGNVWYLDNKLELTKQYWAQLPKSGLFRLNRFEKKFVGAKRPISKFFRFLLVVIVLMVAFKIYSIQKNYSENSVNNPSEEGLTSSEESTTMSIDLSALDSFEFSDTFEKMEDEQSTTEKALFDKDLKMFSTDPNDQEPITYERYETGGFTANVPDYTHYNEQDVKTILGEPVKVISNHDGIVEQLKNEEFDRISEELEQGKLTKEQAAAFMAQATDVLFVATKALMYDGDKPNIYLSASDEVMYITPKVTYINFNGKK